jgi:Glu-tRNA(Gln) amidotransferase subunit E-like FAD-binding protein
MKIIIDLEDPDIKQQIERAIDSNLKRLTAEHVEAVVSDILSKKMDRATKNLDKVVEKVIRGEVDDQLSKKVGGYGSDTFLVSTVKDVALEAMKKKLL